MKKIAIALLVVAIATLGLSPVQATERNSPSEVSEVFVSEVSVPHVLNVDLRTLAPAPEWKPGDPIETIPEGAFADFAVLPVEGWQDPVRQSAGGPLFSGAAKFTFVAHPSGNSNPPDTVGDVGPNHYISMVNASRFAIWDKNGANLVPETNLASLWDGGSSPCTDGDGDPIVKYDQLADRWLMQEFDQTGNTFCIYVSQGPNPVTDGWFAYDFSAPSFPDYPQYGVWPDAYYVSSNEGSFLGLYAFDRDAMLVGAPATFQRFTVSVLFGPSPRVTRILPADLDGSTLPPGGFGSGIFLRTVHETQDNTDPNTRIEIFEYIVDFGNPGNSSVTLGQTLIPAPFAFIPCAPGIRDCVPQPGTDNKLDALFNRAMRDLDYRNFGSHESMVVSQVVDAGGGIGGIRWWELRRTVVAEGLGWSIHQESTYNPDSDYRFMGSITMNANGDMALGYSVSSDSVLPAIRVTARRSGDPLNEMTMEELELVPGAGVLLAGGSRWGDYTSMDVDPVDDQTLWYVNQRLESNNTRSVWVGAFRLDGLFIDGFESGDTSAWDNTVP